MDDRFSLAGKVALVTGAGGALGSHFAATLSAAGAVLVLAGRQIPPLQELAARLAAGGAQAHVVSMDVCDPSSVSSAFSQAQSAAGLIRIVVCAAGVVTHGRALELSLQDWDRVLDTNLRGCWLVASEAARRLVDADQEGAIVNVSSILGHRAAGNVLPYGVSKAGVEHMTRLLALEWARHGIRVNALAPGYIETDLNRDFLESESGQALMRRIPQRRLGQASDLDGALLLLASDASRYMTGSSLVVDGGHLTSTL